MEVYLKPIGYEESVVKLPDSVRIGWNGIKELLPNMTGAELQARYNPGENENVLTQCRSPLALLGKTKDDLIAYCGEDYIGIMTTEELRQHLEADPQNDINRRLVRDLENIR